MYANMAGFHSVTRFFDVFFDLVRGVKRLRTWPLGIGKYMHSGKADLFCKGQRLCKLGFCFAWETDHDVGGDGCVWKGVAQVLYDFAVLCCGVMPVHARKGCVAPALQG